MSGDRTPPKATIDCMGVSARARTASVDLVEVILKWALFLTLACTLVGLLMAMAGMFSSPAVVLLGVPLAAVIGLYWGKDPGGVAMSAAPFVALLIILAFVLSAAVWHGEQVVSGRDGGTYANTAMWLDDRGTLVVDPDATMLASTIEGLETATTGFFERRRGEGLEPQFLHSYSVLAALGSLAAGRTGILATNAIYAGVALLAFFALARRLIGRAWAVVALVALAFNLVVHYYARNSFSEVPAMMFVFGGLWALDVAWVEQNRKRGLVAGLMLGGAAMVRIDGLLLLPLVAAWRSFDGGTSSRGGVTRTCLIGFWVSLSLAFLDLMLFSPEYLGPKGEQVGLVLGAYGVVLVGQGVAPRVRSWFTEERVRLLVRAAVGAIVLGGVYVLLVRPWAVEVTGRTYAIESLQVKEGLEVDPLRRYGELSAWWLVGYVGLPAVVLAILGWANATWIAFRNHALRWVPFLSVFATFTVVFLARPSVNPDQIWAMRRYLMVAIPGLLILAAFALSGLTQAAAGWRRWVAVVGTATLVIPPFLVLWPVLDFREAHGSLEAFERTCSEIPPGSTVLVLDTDVASVSGFVVVPFRTVCGLVALWSRDPGSGGPGESVVALSNQVEGTLWIASADRETLLRYGEDDEVIELLRVETELLERRLNRPPGRFESVSLTVFGVPFRARS
jgi:hypothetical protein